MDPRLLKAVRRNDLESFTKLVGEDAGIVKQRSEATGDTALHVAARRGHVELAKEIIREWPESAAAENLKLETPFHEACGEGHAQIMLLLLLEMEKDEDLLASSKLSHEIIQSLLFVACSRGHVEVVKILLNRQWLRDLIDDDGLDPACFLEAASTGCLGWY